MNSTSCSPSDTSSETGVVKALASSSGRPSIVTLLRSSTVYSEDSLLLTSVRKLPTILLKGLLGLLAVSLSFREDASGSVTKKLCAI